MVLPWVPATAMQRLSEAMAASVSARDSTGIPRRRASTSSGLSCGDGRRGGDHVGRHRRLAAAWPMVTGMPATRSRSVTADALRSLPVTVCPMACSTVAMALMPAPPIPTTWHGQRTARDRRTARCRAPRSCRPPSGRRPGVGLDHPGAGGGGVRPAHDRGRPAHGLEAGRVGEQPVEPGGQSGRPSHSGSGSSTDAPARSSTRALAVWWSPGRAGQRHQDDGHPGHGQLGHGHRPGPAHHQVGGRVDQRPSAPRRAPGPGSRARPPATAAPVRSGAGRLAPAACRPSPAGRRCGRWTGRPGPSSARPARPPPR